MDLKVIRGWGVVLSGSELLYEAWIMQFVCWLLYRSKVLLFIACGVL